jgi:class 3 adenylate cyclase
MPTFKPDKSELVTVSIEGEDVELLSHQGYGRFDASVLGLGDLKAASRRTEAIAAMFDLQGFTHFSKQIEPHLAVPKFLGTFLPWLVAELRAEMTYKEHEKGIQLYSSLPFFLKFMGDGLIVLWDCDALASNSGPANVVLTVYEICRKYAASFYPSMAKRVSEAPRLLRCGVARGTVFSVGDGNDYVGSCINMAARLQKLGGLTFAVNARGFDFHDYPTDFFKTDLIVAEVAIRGIGDHELVGILKKEYDKLDEADRRGLKPV